MRRTIKIHERDNVVIALAPLDADIRIGNGAGEVLTTSQIPRGHKIALTKFEVGQPLIKYGFPIGRATQEINPGDWVHTHNLETMLGDNVEYSYRPSTATYFGPMTPEAVRREAALPRKEFKGYRRTKGTGTRNEIWIVNTVACVNNAAERIARQAHEQYATGNIDGIYAFPHPYGCSQLGDDLKATQKCWPACLITRTPVACSYWDAAAKITP